MRFIEETRDGRGRNPGSDVSRSDVPGSDIPGSDDDAARSDDSRGIDLQADDLQTDDSKAGALAINASEVEGLSDRASGGDASADRGCRGCDSKVNVVPKAIRA
jgi:hypothetical protein